MATGQSSSKSTNMFRGQSSVPTVSLYSDGLVFFLTTYSITLYLHNFLSTSDAFFLQTHKYLTYNHLFIRYKYFLTQGEEKALNSLGAWQALGVSTLCTTEKIPPMLLKIWSDYQHPVRFFGQKKSSCWVITKLSPFYNVFVISFFVKQDHLFCVHISVKVW